MHTLPVSSFIPDSQAALRYAEFAMGRESPERALILLEELLERFPRAARLRVFCARAHAELGEAELAEQELRRAVKSAPRCWAAAEALAELLQERSKPEEAIQVLEHAVARNPDCPQAAQALGEALADSGRFDEAWVVFHDLLDRDAMNPYHHGYLGEALRLAGRTSEAIQALRTALWLHPGYAWAARQLAGLLYERGEMLGAREVLRNVRFP